MCFFSFLHYEPRSHMCHARTYYNIIIIICYIRVRTGHLHGDNVIYSNARGSITMYPKKTTRTRIVPRTYDLISITRPRSWIFFFL